jgi:putative pyruvate formate lyase activating enzyme
MASYLKLSLKEIRKRAQEAWELLNPCQVCPRECGVNRHLGSPRPAGFCRMGKNPVVSSAHPHFGEESVLVGSSPPVGGSGRVGGSGTIFFTSCNLACVYCQNWEISQKRLGRKVSIKNLAQMMIRLQSLGCHNINFVSPSIWAPQILKALIIAVDRGLKVPLVYNTGGYDSVKTLKLLDGIIDIYMPDVKYADDEVGQKYSQVANYWQVNKKALKEMFKQVGDLKINKEGIAQKGLLVRHLVLPHGLAGSKKVMKFLASLSKETYVNIMDQYRPVHKAYQYPQINRAVTPNEFQKAIELARKEGLRRFDKKEPRFLLRFL